MKKADEMEMAVNFSAMRAAWVFGSAALLIYCIVEYVNGGELPLIPFLIFSMQQVLFYSAKILIMRRLVGKNKNEAEDHEE